MEAITKNAEESKGEDFKKQIGDTRKTASLQCFKLICCSEMVQNSIPLIFRLFHYMFPKRFKRKKKS